MGAVLRQIDWEEVRWYFKVIGVVAFFIAVPWLAVYVGKHLTSFDGTNKSAEGNISAKQIINDQSAVNTASDTSSTEASSYTLVPVNQ